MGAEHNARKPLVITSKSGQRVRCPCVESPVTVSWGTFLKFGRFQQHDFTTESYRPVKSEKIFKEEEQCYHHQEIGPVPLIFPPIKEEVDEDELVKPAQKQFGRYHTNGRGRPD
uniref:Uncharacterized protein n=1 Tax=Timema genevievae TaxID=629358 RepID=A0A7R9JYX5_TIMGE|nr:unnamed protein product [Timema genevievae]